jgi:mRNA interferase MazF
VKSGSRDLYIPGRGDIIWTNFTPQAGREQAGRRPALVLSTIKYNRRVGLALVCPISTRAKGYPGEVTIPEGLAVSGVILADQVKSIDWQARGAEFADQMPLEVISEVVTVLTNLLPPPPIP